MIFNSLQFALFFAIVILAYWSLPHKLQNRFLLVASYFFYGWWDWRFLGLLAFSTAVDFTVGQMLPSAENEVRRKRLLLISMVTNLGVLGVFKYFGFFSESLNSALESVGIGALGPSLSIVLPVGISFYTFQSMSYTIDIYRGELEPVKNPLDFALYVSYFPQLVAGPIERATRLVPQLIAPRTMPSGDRVVSGLALIAIGLTKKVVIADVAAGAVNEAFAESGSAGAVQLLVGVYAFALQIYGDFSGYSDIARGTSRLLGIELIENFKQPYLSTSITDFWRRWHISLSNWLRDYLYIPLGGNQKGPRRTYINLALTMLLGGLWHGAASTFIVWGALHGSFLAIERFLKVRRETPLLTASGLVRAVITFHLVCLAWVFFRADSFGQAFEVISGIATLRAGEIPTLTIVNVLLTLGALTLFIDTTQRVFNDEIGIRRLHPAMQGAFFGVAGVLVLLMSGGEGVPFVYFQF